MFASSSLASMIPGANDTIIVGVSDTSSDLGRQDIVFSVRSVDNSLSVQNIGSIGGWSQMVSPTESGTPFWDQQSSDGSGLNIGHCVVRSGGFAGNANCPGYSIPLTRYWGVGVGSDDDFGFTSRSGIIVEMMTSLAAIPGDLYWYNLGNPQIIAGYYYLFGSSSAPGTTVLFEPDGDIGFAFVPQGGAPIYTEVNGLNWALLQGSTAPVPEPAGVKLVLAGLLLLVPRFFNRSRQ